MYQLQQLPLPMCLLLLLNQAEEDQHPEEIQAKTEEKIDLIHKPEGVTIQIKSQDQMKEIKTTDQETEIRIRDQETEVRITNLEKEVKIKPGLTADLTSAQETAVLDLHPLGLVKRIQMRGHHSINRFRIILPPPEAARRTQRKRRSLR